MLTGEDGAGYRCIGGSKHNILYSRCRQMFGAAKGEAFGEKLRRAGVEVTALCAQEIIHHFVILHALDEIKACRTAINASVMWINDKNESGPG